MPSRVTRATRELPASFVPDLAKALTGSRDPGHVHNFQTGPRPRVPNAKQWTLVATILASSMTFIDGTVVNVALPALQRSLDATITDVQWVVEAYALFLGALILVGGSLGDQLGRKRVFLLGVVAFTGASVLCGFAPTSLMLIIGRALQGIGAAFLVPGVSRSSAPRSRRRARASDRNVVGLQRDHDGDRPGDRRMVRRARELARRVLHQRAARRHRRLPLAPLHRRIAGSVAHRRHRLGGRRAAPSSD